MQHLVAICRTPLRYCRVHAICMDAAVQVDKRVLYIKTPVSKLSKFCVCISQTSISTSGPATLILSFVLRARNSSCLTIDDLPESAVARSIIQNTAKFPARLINWIGKFSPGELIRNFSAVADCRKIPSHQEMSRQQRPDARRRPSQLLKTTSSDFAFISELLMRIISCLYLCKVARNKKIRRFSRNVSGVAVVSFRNIFFFRFPGGGHSFARSDSCRFNSTVYVRAWVNLTCSWTFLIKISKLCLQNVDTFFKSPNSRHGKSFLWICIREMSFGFIHRETNGRMLYSAFFKARLYTAKTPHRSRTTPEYVHKIKSFVDGKFSDILEIWST